MSSILLICALPEEKEALIEVLAKDGEQILLSKKLNLKMLKFDFKGNDIYVQESGMGNVNAGVALALALEKVDIDKIVLIGVGGALSSKLKIGDMVISNKVLQHDYLSSLDAGDFRMAPGELILSHEDAHNFDPIISSKFSPFSFDVGNDIKVHQGVILSGSEFVATTKRKLQLAELAEEALLVDMEASAIAFIAKKAGVPFIIAKTVSDRLMPDGSIEVDFIKFVKDASKNAAIITKNILNSLEQML